MKKIFLICLLVVIVTSCKEKNTKDAVAEVPVVKTITDDVLESAVIYEANIRQYSSEGTFDAFTKDIPQLKELGVKVIWLMPVFPISETKRKATGGDFASLIEDEATRDRMLGSYYAVSDFTKVNPEFGTKEDFQELIVEAHNNDMYVILDWVPNHTGWDHVWLKDHPDFYTKNADGEITDPLNEDGTPVGWADVADLNYDNKALWEEMIVEMKYWITEEGVDGFRCDVAGSVPVAFWEYSIPKLRAEKDIFMLAEAWEPELLKGDTLFDMAYAWEGHHVMNEIAQGKKTVLDLDAYMVKMDSVYEQSDILMNFVTNHDENSWNGTLKERMGDASEAMTALIYSLPGMPLIYSGQEYDLDHRLLFFEKDEIPHTKGKFWPVLDKLGSLKNHNPALNGAKNKASYQRISTSKDSKILAFRRDKGGKELIYIANLSKDSVRFTVPITGDFKNAMSDENVSFVPDEQHNLEPWQYLILIK
ncbi:alpha-amylase family glycosyl hydrolase [Ulvibacter antarcticus]|uniref:Alpha amylase catalytic subunit n=1 Tax=Ulvibacter antarcticus TaxID=442714 RepID=A0A3L9YI12_9FLAO|nr:alpha-amylase family glycosyl hydrolase [Ulvibacter antarcticus]RMA58839.1 alpha amylase catalytic subunit [Ulvibacter antarcticus]